MDRPAGNPSGSALPAWAPATWRAVLLLVLAAVSGPVPAQEEISYQPLFDWDIISLEQNNPRFNGSVLTGFHSVRSPGVTPYRGWKTGLGFLYTREEQISEVAESKRFTYNQLILNPKLNYGFFWNLEAGAGLAASYATGRELVSDGAGGTAETDEENIDLSSVDLGVKWNLLNLDRLRFALAFDSRLALNRGEFGLLSGNFFNLELDTDFAVTNRFSVAGNLQLLTSDRKDVRTQVMSDIAAIYSFTDQFRGMLFGTIKEDDEARTALGFVGIAGQYVIEQHSFTLAFDLLLNDADR
ncbi:MAG: hypothetical protein JXA90_01660, partial [Planctomycetes bacterium]|nr:hypothetical protein [Planctomycetota bacterium]